MKTKRLLTLLLVVATAFCAAFAVGCKGKEEKPATVESVTLSEESVELNTGDALDYSAYTVTAGYSDGTTTTVPLTEAMLNAEDLAKFNTPGTYTVTVNAFGMQATLTVTVKNRNFADVTAEDVNATYDGTAKLPEVANLPQGASVVWTYYVGTSAEGKVVDKPVNAGTYYAEGVVSLRYYNDKVVTANITISPKTINPAELNWANAKRVYTGKEITVNAYPEDLPENITIDGYEGTVKATEVGEYNATVKFRNDNSNYTIAETYDITWSIIKPLEAKWIGADNGNLLVASFANSSDTTGSLTFNGAVTSYTVSYDGNANPTFSNLSGNVSAVVLKGQVLRVTVGSKSYVLVSEDDLKTYFAGEKYSTIVSEIEIVLDESAKTLNLVLTDKNGETVKPLSLSATESEVSSANVKLVADENTYVEYYSSYKTLRFYGYVNPNGYKSESYYDLVTKAKVDEKLAGLVNGTFVDVDGKELRINGAKDVKYNGRTIELYAACSYGTPAVYAAIGTDTVKAELVIGNGYYKFNGSVYYDKAGIAFAGTYYLDNDGTLSDTEKVEFMSYASYGNFDVRTKLLNAENTAESKTFTVNAAETSDRAVLNLADGELTATLYLKNSTEVYATLVFKDNGATVVYGSKNFLKVDKLIEKAGWSSGEYYSADGTKLKYDGKGKFTLGDTDYTKYSLVFADGTLTVTIGEGDNTHVIVYTEKRYVTLDDEIYLNDQSYALSDGYKDTATFISGDDTISVSKNVVKVNDVALTDVVFSFVDDGNNNGRNVLKISGKLGEDDYDILFYTLGTVKADGKGFAIKMLEPYYGATFIPAEDETKSFGITTDGKVMINGHEVFPESIGNSGFTYYIEKDGLRVKGQMYDNSSYGYATIAEGDKQYDYNSEFFRQYKGMYVAEDNSAVFAFLKAKLIFANETSYTSYSIKSTTDDEVVLTVGGKDATFSTVSGVDTVVYDGKTFKKDKDFVLDNYYGKYSVFNGGVYDEITVDANIFGNRPSVELSKFVMYGGSYVPVFTYNYYNKAYVIKNTDASSANELPYYAVNEYYLKYIGKGKLSGKTLEISLSVGTKNDKKLPVLDVLYDGAAVNVIKYESNKLTAVIGEKNYYIEATSGDEKEYAGLKVYETQVNDYTGTYNFNGNVTVVAVAVNANGESYVKITFNGEEVNAALTDMSFGKKIEFSFGGVKYVGNMSANYAYPTPKVRIMTEKEYDFFFGATYDETADDYSVTVGTKAFKFNYDLNTLSRNYSAYEIAFNTAKTSFDGKAATFVYYVKELKTVIFGTEDGNFAYNVETGVLTENVTFDGLREFIYDKTTAVNGDLYVTARITGLDGTVAKVEFFYDFGSSGMNKLTATAIDEGYKLVGKDTSGNDVTSYLLAEGKTYALYTQEQYEIIGTYTVGDKQLVIEGTHEKGKFAYTAKYGDANAVAVDIDFTAKSFMIKGDTSATIFNWTTDNGAKKFTASEVSAAALKFLIDGDYMINLDNSYYNYLMKITIKGVVDGKVKFNIVYRTYSSYTVEGTLSDDGNYISAYISYKLRIYINAQNDYYYKLVAVKESSSAVDYLGTFTVNENESLTIALGAESKEDDDYDLEGLKSSCFKVTYKGQTVTAKTPYSSYSTFSSGIEFTVDGKTYVAKLVDGAMTVTEKTAA